MARGATRLRIVWREEALWDLLNLHSWLFERSARATERIERRIHARVSQLLEHPDLGRPGRVDGTRELAVGGTPYLVIYVARPDRVVILAVRHGRQAI